MEKTPPRVVERTPETAPLTRPVVVLVTTCAPRLRKEKVLPRELSSDAIATCTDNKEAESCVVDFIL